ncbi:chemotaxis protein CheD [Oscillospiraceae bacterium MB08-C2-2]|nr:chemotaxis protein CheD [Oscillospiraceae bacterium MB08-C2-2]
MATLVVGISDLKVAAAPDILVTYALGSCVGTCLLDPATRVGGLSHIMLPQSSASPSDPNVMKFADTAIPELIRQMELKGARRNRLVAKIAGGAQMFDLQNKNPMWQIGQRNVQAVLQILGQLRIPVAAQDVLANYGRTTFFDPSTGIMTVKSINKNIKEL